MQQKTGVGNFSNIIAHIILIGDRQMIVRSTSGRLPEQEHYGLLQHLLCHYSFYSLHVTGRSNLL